MRCVQASVAERPVEVLRTGFGGRETGRTPACMGKGGVDVQSLKQPREFGADDKPACPSCCKPMHLIRRGPHPDNAKCETQIFLCPCCKHQEIRSADVHGRSA